MANVPNIVLIMPDQQRTDSISCYGNIFTKTPNLDRLAKTGVVFENFFTSWPICTPARATMWTGLYAHTHRIIHNRYGIDDVYEYEGGVKTTIFEALQEQGYTTAYYGKWHLGEENSGRFDIWEGFNSHGGHWEGGFGSGDQYKPEKQTDQCIEFLKSDLAKEKPFVMVQGYYPPHNPYTAPDEFMEMYRGTGVPFPGYYAAVSALDHYTGRIMDALEEEGLRDNTIIIYFSDHGETFNYREFMPHKYVCFEESIRVPMIVSWPAGLKAGQRQSALTGMQDLTPTIADAMKVDMPYDMHGESMLPLMTGEKDKLRDSYYVQCEVRAVRTPQRCIRTDDWKLILSADEKHHLYNLVTDPEEELNVFDTSEDDKHCQFGNFPDYSEKIIELAKELRATATSLEDWQGVELAEIILEQKKSS